MMDLHDLILISASGVAGFVLHCLLEIWADHRAKPYVEGWQKSDEIARNLQLREAYRYGQDQAYPRAIEAPTPYQFDNSTTYQVH